MKINRLILASTSRFRRLLLEQAGISASGLAPTCQEDLIWAESPLATAQRRAEAKALSLGALTEGVLVIGADQVLEFQGQAYGKADDRKQAGHRLRLFAGHSHQLHSALSLAVYRGSEAPRLIYSEVVTAQLTMRTLSDEEIEAYLASGEWEGCAGCYQYENRGAQLFKQVHGEQSTIMGLPIVALLEALRGLGVNTLTAPHGPWEIDE